MKRVMTLLLTLLMWGSAMATGQDYPRKGAFMTFIPKYLTRIAV